MPGDRYTALEELRCRQQALTETERILREKAEKLSRWQARLAACRTQMLEARARFKLMVVQAGAEANEIGIPAVPTAEEE